MNTVAKAALPNATAAKSSLPAPPAMTVSTNPSPTAAICASIIGQAKAAKVLASLAKTAGE